MFEKKHPFSQTRLSPTILYCQTIKRGQVKERTKRVKIPVRLNPKRRVRLALYKNFHFKPQKHRSKGRITQTPTAWCP